MFRGKREAGVDYFDDVLGEVGGIHEGTGLNDFEGVKERLVAEGLQLQMKCRLCGKSHNVVLEWEELFVVGSNNPGMAPVLPPNWRYSQNNQDAYTMLACSRCGGEGLAPHVTPEDARKIVNQGVSRGLVPPQAVNAWKQRVAMARGG